MTREAAEREVAEARQTIARQQAEQGIHEELGIALDRTHGDLMTCSNWEGKERPEKTLWNYAVRVTMERDAERQWREAAQTSLAKSGAAASRLAEAAEKLLELAKTPYSLELPDAWAALRTALEEWNALQSKGEGK